MKSQVKHSAADVAVTDLAREAAAFGISIPTDARQRFQVYLDTLLLWRSRLSLTAASSAQQIIHRHILDSFAIVRFVKAGSCVADIGSGAGFPGIPVAIVCPAARVVLIESRRKRANFLREVVRKIELANVEVLDQRAESLGPGHRCSFDLVVSRALGSVVEFLALAAPLLKPSALAVAMKGPRAFSEVATATTAFAGPEVRRYPLPGDIRRVLLVYRRL